MAESCDGRVIHMCGMVYGVILAYVIARLDTGMATLVGAADGLALYYINFYGFTVSSWFADARDGSVSSRISYRRAHGLL